jgi:putative DNA primase/helicase
MSFHAHAQAHGLMIRDLIADGRWHRVPTTDHPKKRNGAYVFDGAKGAVQNWATMQDVALYRPDGQQNISRVAFRAQNRKSFDDERQRHAKARQEAMRIVRECERAEHPYLARKGFPDLRGLVHPSGDLIIPMRDMKDYGVVNTLQRVSPGGEKLFLMGGKAKGSVFVLGKGNWRERWLCEGYATGLSLQAALIDLRRQAEIIVCFSAGNMVHVATLVKRAFVMADHDVSGAGQRAANDTGFPWVMPAGVGNDANDVHLHSGLRALVSIVQSLEEASATR